MPQNSDKAQKEKNPTFALVRRLVKTYLSPYKAQMLVAILFMAVAAAMTALIAGLMQPVLDDVLYGGKESLIIPVSLGLAATFAVRGVSTYGHTVMMSKIGHHIVADIQNHLFSNFMRLDLAFFHKHDSGALLSNVINDVSVMRSSVTNTLTGLGKSLFTLIFLIGLMFYRDWKLTLAAFIVFPLLSVFVIYIGTKLRKLSKSIQSELGSLSGILSQTFRGIRLVKAYRMEDYEIEHTKKTVHVVRDLNVKSAQVSSISTPVNEIIVGLIFAAIIIYGGYEVIAGRTSPGHLASFIAAFTLAYEPMKKLAKLNNSLQTGLGATERVFAMIDETGTINNREDAKDLSTKRPEIKFDNVDFSYDGDTDIRALSSITFTAKPDQVTALVGPSGGGKSTVINLIPRFYDVVGGNITVDGQDIRDLTLKSLRDHIALVSQDITIFNDTVAANIGYGDTNASQESIIKAAKAAAAHEFIEKLENGYDTVVGESGIKLSGGQKQRISIARAILRDAPILLLDEATSALDNESEKLVQNALKSLQEGRTTLVIAHRLTTVQEADQIIVLDRGRIAEQGTHEDLLSMDKIYADMYKTGMKD